MRSLKAAGVLTALLCSLAWGERAVSGARQDAPNYQQPPPYQPPPGPPQYQPPPNYQQPPPSYPQYQPPPPAYQPPPSTPQYQPPPNYQQPPPGYPQYQPPPPAYQQAPPGYPPPAPGYAPPPGYPPPANAEALLAAVWVPKELRFTFMGFTAKYSCDGLQERVRSVLLKLGARADLQVRQGPCAGSLGEPTLFPTVSIKMNVLEPADRVPNTGNGAPPQVVPAQWRRVDLTASNDAVKQAGDCEVIEQIKQSILPQFTTRNVDYKSTCVPHQLTLGGTQLHADVLVSAEPPAKAASTSAAR